MKVVLQGGPANGRELELPPGQRVFRVPVPRELTVFEYANLNPWDVIVMPVAQYGFSGIAHVNPSGEVLAVIYTFEGME